MKKQLLLLTTLLITVFCFGQQQTDAYWKSKLTPEQYRVTRQHGTEPSFSGALLTNKADGIYTCVCCGSELFDSKTKFDSGTGWPSYYSFIGSNVEKSTDHSFGMMRDEVHCANCKAHLGHVFDDGPPPTGLRYCINSVSLEFRKR